MTKIADFSSFTPEQLDELRDIFTRFEFILETLTDFQKSLRDMGADYDCPVVSVLRLFSDSWQQNSILFSKYFSSSEFFLEKIACYIQSASDVFATAELAVKKDLASPLGCVPYALILEGVCLRCRELFASSLEKMRKNGISLEVK